MSYTRAWSSRVLGWILALSLCGAPEILGMFCQAQNTPAPEDQTQQSVDTPATTQNENSQAPPSAVPDAPSSVQGQAPPASNTPSSQQQKKTSSQEPAGVGAAQAGPTSGGPASKPAGMAIAPAKQRQVRSFLIKLGAIAGGAVAIGTVLALSSGSPNKPPGAK
jgi:hypothetical protein